MAIKKSELYSMLWKSCDELRGGMDASQYKDYVLVILFVKYVSDKYKNDPDSLIEIPEGCTFDDFVALKWKTNIGEEINKKMAALAEANDLSGVINVADFCDEQKLGKGKDLVDTVSSLIGVFQSSGLDFGKNRANDDDLMGDAYEYLMKHFASESGKSKGQFYTPAEVSRIMAKVIGLQQSTSTKTTIYDPTCGSGSLLLKALAETQNGKSATLYGQEKDSATVGLAKMNMILHGEDLADIRQGDTINNPQHKAKHDGNTLETFDYVVANPPFSTKAWLRSAQEDDLFGRWNPGTIGVPPEKNGDFAFLLHIIRTMNHKGQGACILPHGVLFRGNAEATIRKYIVEKGYIKGIIGLPANLFYGTGIPACILVLDKKEAADRKGIFMIDAKAGFAKDGPKNRLREQDVRRIVDTWNAHKPVPHYARFVEKAEIVRNDYNLNLPRYIESEDTEIVQDIEAHLKGGLPKHDIDQLQHYWDACPQLKDALFEPIANRPGYYNLKCSLDQIREAVQQHPDFIAQTTSYHKHFAEWKAQVAPMLYAINNTHPKNLIQELGDLLLEKFAGDVLLVESYDVYEQLLTYWNETMQDDAYLITADGWKADLYTPQPAAKKDKDGNLKKVKEKKATTPEDVVCDLLPVPIVIDEYFPELKALIAAAEEKIAESESALNELMEEEAENFLDSANFANDTINEGNVKKRIKELKDKTNTKEDIRVLEKYLSLKEDIADGKRVQKALKYELLEKLTLQYKALTEEEIRRLVVENKWFGTLAERLNSEMQQISQNLTTRISELAERYEQTLTAIDTEIVDLEEKVKKHLVLMGFAL